MALVHLAQPRGGAGRGLRGGHIDFRGYPVTRFGSGRTAKLSIRLGKISIALALRQNKLPIQTILYWVTAKYNV